MLRIDNDGEVCGNGFEEFCNECGTEMKNTTPYTPKQNGVTERMNGTLIEKAMSMLSVAR